MEHDARMDSLADSEYMENAEQPANRDPESRTENFTGSSEWPDP
jgi:hypothetical protein